jgi:hypothetical protein
MFVCHTYACAYIHTYIQTYIKHMHLVSVHQKVMQGSKKNQHIHYVFRACAYRKPPYVRCAACMYSFQNAPCVSCLYVSINKDIHVVMHAYTCQHTRQVPRAQCMRLSENQDALYVFHSCTYPHVKDHDNETNSLITTVDLQVCACYHVMDRCYVTVTIATSMHTKNIKKCLF